MLAGALLLGGCTGGSSIASRGSEPAPAPAGAPSVAPPAPSPSLTPGPSTPLPSPVSTVDPFFASGQDVYLAPDGPQPRQLIAKVNEPITFHNLGDAEVVVEFVNASFLAPLTVPPGTTARFTSDRTVSIVYTTSSSPAVGGAIQVEPTVLPGFQ